MYRLLSKIVISLSVILLSIGQCGADPLPETLKWVEAVRASDGGNWNSKDIEAINILVEAVNGNATLMTARAQGKLLLAPFRGPNSASRHRCLYHPKGATVALTGTLGDSAYTANGLKGDGAGYADTLFDGSGLQDTNFAIVLHGRSFEELGCDPTVYLVFGKATSLNRETGIYKKDYSKFFTMGSTFGFGLGGTIGGTAYPSGTIGFISDNSIANQYRYYFNAELVVASRYPERRSKSGMGTGTFTLLGDGPNKPSKATVQTFMMSPALPELEYVSLQVAIAKANADRSTYKDVMKIKSPRRIWIFAGQSNCAGDQINVKNVNNRSVYPDDDWHPNILQWGRTGVNAGKAVPASHPMDFDGGGAGVNVGPAMMFAKQLLEKDPNQEILIIPAAVGATGFSSKHWNPGDEVYEKMVAMVTNALSEGGTIAGMVWNQGEGDVSMNQTSYPAAWENMFQNLASRIPGGWPSDAVVIIGELANPAKNSMNNWFNKIVAAGPRRVLVTKSKAGLDGLSDEEKFDDMSKIHFSAKAQRIMGAAYAQSVLSTITAAPSKPEQK